MAMFELEDSEEVSLEKCKTDGETLLKGKKLAKVDAYDCEVRGRNKSLAKDSGGKRTVAARSFRWTMGIVSSVAVAGIAKWLFG